ncbi:MAG TPA: ferritin [Gemmatimonadales bacterium]|jgi:ferritin
MQKSIVEAINQHIGREFGAAYLYLSMSAYLEGQNLAGFAHWMKAQHAEEMGHGMRLFTYLLDRGEKVVLEGIKKPAATFGGPLDVLEKSLAHERIVSASITALYELAVKHKDYATQHHMQWFIDEQLEEERTFETLIARLKMAGDKGPGLLMIDRELAQRGGA